MRTSRRTFLRAAGVSLALPWLECRAEAGAAPPRRMVCVCTPLGLHPPSFFPAEAGPDYRPSLYLERLGALRAGAGAADRDKLDEYFTSVRELERRLATTAEWAKKPKPKVDAKPPQNNTNPADLVGKTRLMFDLVHLALQTDSSRLVTYLMLGTSLVPPIPGVSLGHHDLSHHGQDPGKIKQLQAVELEQMTTLRDFLQKLKGTKEEGETLLDRTTVFFSSNLGNAATHSARNLPVLVAGGGFRHGRHLAFDQKAAPPLSNLFVTMLQRLGAPIDRFGPSTGPLDGLTLAGR